MSLGYYCYTGESPYSYNCKGEVSGCVQLCFTGNTDTQIQIECKGKMLWAHSSLHLSFNFHVCLKTSVKTKANGVY